MVDQLRLDVTVAGGDAALRQLDQIDQRMRAIPQTAQQSAQAQVSAADRIAAADQKLRDSATLLSAEFDKQAAAAERSAQRQEAAAQRKAAAEEAAAQRAVKAQEQLIARGNLIVGGSLSGAGAGIGAALAEAVQQGAQFERTFAMVQVVSQATAEQMDRMQAAALRLGASTTFNSQEVAKGFEELTQAGLTVNEALQAIEPSIRAAMLANQGLDQTTNMIAHTMRQFGFNAGDIPHIVDAMTVAAQGSTLKFSEFGDLFENLRGRTRQLGISFEETTALLMSMVNAGIPASAAGTALGTAIDRISKQSGEAAQGLRLLGVNAYDANGNFIGFTTLLERIAAVLPTMTQQQQAQALSLLAGSRASGAFATTLNQQVTVMKDGNEVTLQGTAITREYTEQLQHADGVSAKAAQTIGATAAVQWKNFTASVQESGIQVGREFLPAIEATLPQLTALVNQFVTASPAVHETAAVVAVATAGTLALGGAIITAAGAMALFGTAIGAALAAAAPLLITIGLIAAAGAALAAAWINDWGGVREKTEAVATSVQTTATSVQSDLTELTTYATRELIPKWNAFWQAVQGPRAAGGLVPPAEAPFGPTVPPPLPGGAQATDVFGPQGPQSTANYLPEGVLTPATGGRLSAEESGLGPLGNIKGQTEILWEDIKESNARAAATAADAAADNYAAQLNRRRPVMHEAAAATGEEFGTGVVEGTAAGIAPLPERVQEILNNVSRISKHTGEVTGYDFAQGITNALKAGDTEAAQALVELERATNLYSQTLRNLTPAQVVHIEQVRIAQGVQAALDEEVSIGVLKLSDYQAAVTGTGSAVNATTAAHHEAKTAVSEYARELENAARRQEEAQLKGVGGFINDAQASAANNALTQMAANLGPVVQGWAKFYEATGQAREAIVVLAKQHGASDTLIQGLIDGDTAAMKWFKDATLEATEAGRQQLFLEQERAHAAQMARPVIPTTPGEVGRYGATGAEPWRLNQMGADMAHGFRENLGSGPEHLGQEIAQGFNSGLQQHLSSPGYQVEPQLPNRSAGQILQMAQQQANAQAAVYDAQQALLRAQQAAVTYNQAVNVWEQSRGPAATNPGPAGPNPMSIRQAELALQVADANARAINDLLQRYGAQDALNAQANRQPGAIDLTRILGLTGSGRLAQADTFSRSLVDYSQQVEAGQAALAAEEEARGTVIQGAEREALLTGQQYIPAIQQATHEIGGFESGMQTAIGSIEEFTNAALGASAQLPESVQAITAYIRQNSYLAPIREGSGYAPTPLPGQAAYLYGPGGGGPGAQQAAAAADAERQFQAGTATKGVEALGQAATTTAQTLAGGGSGDTASLTRAIAGADEAAAASMDEKIHIAGLVGLASSTGADLLKAQHDRAYAAALAETRNTEVAAALADAAVSIMKNLNRQGDLLAHGMMAITQSITTAVGLTYGQIYGMSATNTASGAGGSNQGIVNLAPGNYYGLPVVSPLTGGTLRGFASGGMIDQPTILVNQQTGRAYAHAGENGPEWVGPQGGGNVTVQINASGVDALRDTRFWEQVVDQQLLRVLRRRQAP